MFSKNLAQEMPMSYKTTTLADFVGTSTPTFVGTTKIDGYVNGQPVVLNRLKNGTLRPSVGTTLPSAMGTGVVRGYMDGNVLVDIVSFNEDYVWENADGSDIFDAEEKVKMLNRALSLSLDGIRSTFERVYKSEVTGVLPPSMQAKLDAFIPEITERTLSMSFSPNVIGMDTPVTYKIVAKVKLSPAERRQQRALEIADAKKLRSRLLEKYDDEFGCDEVPDDAIAAELDEMFGEDGEF